jgi:hypothetical protein
MRPEPVVALGLSWLLLLSGCWFFDEEDGPDCPVASRDFDARRMPPLVPAMDGDEAGDSVASGTATITLQAPRGSYDFSIWARVDIGNPCHANFEAPACQNEIELEFDPTGVVPDPSETGALGDFEVERDYKRQGFFQLTCDLDLCKASVMVPVRVEARAFLERTLAVVVESGMSGDLCDERLPIVTVQLSGWEEPPVLAPAD